MPDAEKILLKMAEEEGVDLESMSDEEVKELLEQLEGKAADLGAVDAEGRIKEADLIGRVMSEAFLQASDEDPKLTFPEFCQRVDHIELGDKDE